MATLTNGYFKQFYREKYSHTTAGNQSLNCVCNIYFRIQSSQKIMFPLLNEREREGQRQWEYRCANRTLPDSSWAVVPRSFFSTFFSFCIAN